ncbi:hypothetical protein ACHAWO_006548, partial [Cyclotella atomus]
MGIQGLLPMLPGGAMSDSYMGFSRLRSLISPESHAISDDSRKIKADIDTGTLLYVCALKHRIAYNAGDYTHSVAEFHRQIVSLRVVYKWDMTIIFDGCPPPEKSPEHDRRKSKGDDGNNIIITSEFIALCAHACKRYFHNFVVSPAEADMQVCRRDPTAIAVTRDSDLVAYGLKTIVIVDNYSREEFRLIDMDCAVTDDTKEQYPLFWYYKKYGLQIIHFWAAVMGCDISKGPTKVGIDGIGKKVFFSALDSFDSQQSTTIIDSQTFAKVLRENANSTVRATYSWKQIQEELDRIVHWFTIGGTYYDIDGNVLSVSGSLIKHRSPSTLRHMTGSSDPKTCALFSTSQQQLIESFKPHNLAHNSAADTATVSGRSLPEGRATLNDCRVDELKGLIVCRGGNLTDRDGKALNKAELCRIAMAHLLLEEENPIHTVHFNRSRSNNGVFANIDVSERRTVPQILTAISNADLEQSIKQFALDLLQLYGEDKFVDNFATIALEAPELHEEFIYKEFAHVGDSTNQKGITEGLKRVLEMDQIIYHANARSEDGKSLYVISKQRASMRTDEKTRKKTATGEKPKLKEYLVMMQIAIQPTTDVTRGHTLGLCERMMRSYCAFCEAGCGLCYHRAALLWMQYLHWGEGRPTPKPVTAGFCSWIPGSNSRSCSTIEPAYQSQRMKLPGSSEEAQQKI